MALLAIPMFRQFTNQAILALSNGMPIQIYSDPSGTPTNPATAAVISSISVDAFGVVTVNTATAHGLTTAQAGGNVLIAGVGIAAYDGAFTTIAVPSTTQYKVRNISAIGSGSSSGGTSTTTALPVISTFVPAYPTWTASTTYAVGDIIVPATQPATKIYLTCSQAGSSGSVEPSWPTGGAASIGTQVAETGVPSGTAAAQWTVTGLLNTAAPAPPGAAHIEVYAGALWALNTALSNTSTGLDGPTALRMSGINNANLWNPINQAFLDKDDGTQGMGLAKFTITALGIPPEGTLVAFKDYVPYQILGVFGASNFGIQPVASNMGCNAPRTINFVPGFGIGRSTHLGIAMFDGVRDQVISEQIRPYLFPSNDPAFEDIAVVDASYLIYSWAAQTANPPQFTVLCPVGNSGGALTRGFIYDLVLKAWGIVDFPFPVSTMDQFKTEAANPVTVIGGYSDGALSRWQAGDVQWDTGGTGARTPSNVTWSTRVPTVASQDVDQRIYARRVILTGSNAGLSSKLTVTVNLEGNPVQTASYFVPGDQDFNVDCGFMLQGKRVDAIFSGSFEVEIDGTAFEIEPRPAGVVVGTGI